MIYMEPETANRYLEQDVKIVKNNFALYGRILAVEGNCIVFQTKEKTSAIRLDLIQEIIPTDGCG